MTKRVVVLGGGFAGCTVAKKLVKLGVVKTGLASITLVTPREGLLFLNKLAGLRAATLGESWLERIMVPIQIPDVQLVQASAVAVEESTLQVVLSNGDKLPYDILIVATGTRNFSPGDPGVQLLGVEETKAFYRQMHEKLRAGNDFVICGGGAVAVELAGELCDIGKSNITLVTRAPRLINRKLKLNQRGLQSLDRLLTKKGVRIVYSAQVTSEDGHVDDMANDCPIVHPADGSVTLSTGEKIKCDTLLQATGNHMNSSFLPSRWLDPDSGEVIVEETLRVQGTVNVFAVGDVARVDFAKSAGWAIHDAQSVVARNVHKLLLDTPGTRKYTRNLHGIAVSVGAQAGRTILSRTYVGNWYTVRVLSRDLHTTFSWKMLTGSVPNFNHT